ncbi:sigma-70 family RNA polymerase sigma factor [Candidatus Poribacteria bacterium]|nr:sigma-70 family RNA polymerase sigma factor [Candidatus Poribacteria bacterium]
MSNFNPDFWEIPVPPEYFEQLTTEDHLWHQVSSDEIKGTRNRKRKKVLQLLHQIITKELTPRQNDCVQLYFFEGKTQDEIGDQLGISRRVVSQHLFGVTRDGRKVGGAINKIRKVCRKMGIQYP